ncbi:ABC transporter ATP-binding protein [Cytobacillus dafuensis]|uniref:ABC transporter ATP-binding protein n=1 Tax=Cytobacillus dafuensis TaxID=1742359 RepID=A0A5B8Z831_CYTDA|nr:ABC transporter ATP-binding protein [Cytobacillus dafuensis]QED49110.1 ABC transporter ATP-binding protein [Cytobacillus dafuensis]
MNGNNQTVLEVKNISKWFPQRNSFFNLGEKKWVKSVDGVTFTLNEGEVLGVIGESGCGKSTLGKVLVQLESPTSGEIFLKGEPSTELMKRDSKIFRRNAQMVFQNPFDTFAPRHTIAKIMMRPLEIHNVGSSQEERYEICKSTLEKAGLRPADDYLERYPHELSGGQLQRISILRSMLLKPSFLVADEPVSMLDVSVRADIINMLINLKKENNTAMVFISHDIAAARYISDKIAVMYLGKIVEMGETDEVIQNPQHPYTKALISNCASIDISENEVPIRIDGEPPTPINPGPGCYFAKRCFKATEKCLESYPEYVQKGNDHTYSCFY